MLYEHLQLVFMLPFFFFFSPFVKRWMSFRTRSHVCAREECAGIAPCTRGDGGERRWTHLSRLLPVQLVRGCGGSRSGSPRSRSSQEPVLPSCLPGVSVAALKQAYILSEVSPEVSSIFFLRWRLCLNWPRFTKQSIYACYVEINQSFFHGKSIIFSFTCLPMVIDRNTSRPGKHKAKSRRWAATPTPFFWHYDTESAPACTEIASENGAVGSNTCL